MFPIFLSESDRKICGLQVKPVGPAGGDVHEDVGVCSALACVGGEASILWPGEALGFGGGVLGIVVKARSNWVCKRGALGCDGTGVGAISEFTGASYYVGGWRVLLGVSHGT